jgi:hypothetical protein
MLWDLHTLADRIIDVFERAERLSRLEQAVYGVDSLDELPLQALVADELASHYAIAREVHYPSSVGRKRSHRARCDVVLMPHGHTLAPEADQADLFSPAHPCLPEEALWMEMKVAHQYRSPGVRHGGYGGQWRGGVVEDLRKMEQDPRICHAALLLVVFCESSELLAKDLDLFENVLVQKEVLAGFRQVRQTTLWDRMGHRLAAISLWPTIQRGRPDCSPSD